MNDNKPDTLSHWLYIQMEPSARIGKGLSWLNRFLVFLVLLSFVTLALETEPSVSENLTKVLIQLNWLIISIFAIEYVLRLWVAGEDPKYAGPGGRIKYIFSFYAIADLLAFLPEIIMLLVISNGDARVIAAMKALRLFRLMKLVRYLPAFEMLIAATRRAGSQLVVALGLALALVYISALALYFIEGESQPEAFGSIPRAIWWAVATLTTVGYGDAYPITALGRFAASLIAIAGIGVVALPAGILASAFTDEIREREAAKHKTGSDAENSSD